MVEAIGLAILSAIGSAGVAGAAGFATATFLGVTGATIVGTAAVIGCGLPIQERTEDSPAHDPHQCNPKI